MNKNELNNKKDQLEVIANDMAKNTCIRIFGKQRWEDHLNENPCWQTIQDTYDKVRDTIMALPLNYADVIALDVRENHGGAVVLDKPRHIVEGWPAIVSLEVDENYGAFVRFQDGTRGKNNDEFAYLNEWFSREDIEKIYFFFFDKKRLDKMPYINAIYYALKNCNDNKGFVFQDDTKLMLSYCGDLVLHELVSIYRHDETDEVCISTIVEGQDEPLRDYLLDFDIADLKQIFDVFINQFYDGVPSDQLH